MADETGNSEDVRHTGRDPRHLTTPPREGSRAVIDPVEFERIVGLVRTTIERQAELTTRLDRLATTLESSYVPREIYSTHRDSDRQDVTDIRNRIDQADANRAADRRMYLAALIAPLLVGLLLLYVATQIGGSPT